MNEFKIGGYAVSAAGHDTGKCYVIFQMDSEYVYLVDGRIRTIDRPKKKKLMHVTMLNQADSVLAAKVFNKAVKNEEIKRALKLLTIVNSSKEVE
jgi:ribosomal protein L14E/L6E/L27E